MADGLDDIAALPDPLERTLAEWTRPNGLRIRRIATPIGVIGMIYESRPNVGADAAGLCPEIGQRRHPARRLGVPALRRRDPRRDRRAVCARRGCPRRRCRSRPTPDRAYVAAMLAGAGLIDLLIPRGGKSLVGRVQAEARVPVLAHAEGLCHTYRPRRRRPRHGAGDRRQREAAAHRRVRRHRDAADRPRHRARAAAAARRATSPPWAARSAPTLRRARSCRICRPRPRPTSTTEWLAPTCPSRWWTAWRAPSPTSRRYGSEHTEAIVTEDAAAAEQFLAGLSSAVGLWNASTQFCDGGEFGFGAEIGIATGRVHARGPVGLEQLTSFRYVIHGTGQTRP